MEISWIVLVESLKTFDVAYKGTRGRLFDYMGGIFVPSTLEKEKERTLNDDIARREWLLSHNMESSHNPGSFHTLSVTKYIDKYTPKVLFCLKIIVQ